MTIADYKEFYEHEWQRREQLQSAANTPISVITLAGGGLLLMAKGFETDKPVLFWVFWILAATAACLVGAATYWVIRSLHGFEYERIPYASDLAAYDEQVQQHYRRVGLPGLAPAAFEEYLTRRYIEATDANARNNLRRGDFLHSANRFLVYALSATAIAAVPAGIVTKIRGDTPEQVEITNLRSDGSELIR